MSFENAVNFIKKKKESGNTKNYRIGVLKSDLYPFGPKKGRIVIFTVYDPSKASQNERHFWGRDKSGDPKIISAETPWPPEEIEKRISEGNGIFSYSLGVGIPYGKIREIKGAELTIRRGLSRLLVSRSA